MTTANRIVSVPEALAAISGAMVVVDDLCQGRRKWTMSIPARPDHDPDLIIMEALRKAKVAMESLPVKGNA